MNEVVTVVTPTTGTKYLSKAIASVQNQTYKHIQHLVFVDGKKHLDKVADIVKNTDHTKRLLDIIPLPYSTGENRYNGHRIYGAAPFFCKGEFICFLDEDNWFDEHHIDSLMEAIKGKQWAFSLRKIVDENDNYICNDDCESLGSYPSVINEQDYFVDVGCFFLPRTVALQTSHIWYRKAREPGVPEVDRMLTHVLRNNNLSFEGTGKYTLNYRAGNTERSVKKEFFLQGNDIMSKKYETKYPWRK